MQAEEKSITENQSFVKPFLLILQYREARRREKNKEEKNSSYFWICFSASAERKVVGKVLSNLNSLDSQGVVVVIFSNGEKTPLL